MSLYAVDYFLDKFAAIPAERWCIGGYVQSDGTRCALGHCGVDGESVYLWDTPEARALCRLFKGGYSIAAVNDGNKLLSKLGKTPKERVINGLLLRKRGVVLDDQYLEHCSTP